MSQPFLMAEDPVRLKNLLRMVRYVHVGLLLPFGCSFFPLCLGPAGGKAKKELILGMSDTSKHHILLVDYKAEDRREHLG